MWPKCVTIPVLNSAPFRFARPPSYTSRGDRRGRTDSWRGSSDSPPGRGAVRNGCRRTAGHSPCRRQPSASGPTDTDCDRTAFSEFGPPRLAAANQPCANSVKFCIGARKIGPAEIAVQAVVLAVRMRRVDNLAADVLVEVVRSAANRAHINRRIGDAGGLQLSMGSKVRVPHKYIDARRVDPHWGGCAGSLRTQTSNSKADCTCSQHEPAKIAKRAINHSTSSTQILAICTNFTLQYRDRFVCSIP